MRRVLVIALGVLAGALLLDHTVRAQSPHPPQSAMPGGTMHHHHRQMGAAGAGQPAQAGQDAFGAIAEIVGLLDADPGTDWSRVDLERLRQHLIDMNEVVLRSTVKQAAVPGGLAMEVTGTGRTERAILAMVVPHAAELDRMPAYEAKTETIPGGVRLTVTATNPGDGKAVARLRGLGFVGLLAEGGHHQPHHLAMARGDRLHAH
ncbi:MAG TPA: hypothetical protein VGD07_20770 [Methylomirabilota bacterium]